MKKRMMVAGVLLLLAIGLAACPVQAQETAAVEMSGLAYQPASITVAPGTTVVWTNQDPEDHTVTSTDGTFDSGTIAPGGEFEYTFTEEGTYEYYCTLHPSMTGTVVVEAQEEATPAPENGEPDGEPEEVPLSAAAAIGAPAIAGLFVLMRKRSR
ncbi:copper binding protein, plastocyanin/azurin family [hydrocarbon metagenome]|uniref:Copper binding protein, plastocyanin/azurin family n=1 Tax=hydrocarbon metagenome TaxID=938273 RepID=A0A0W8FH55_9ZZZZ